LAIVGASSGLKDHRISAHSSKAEGAGVRQAAIERLFGKKGLGLEKRMLGRVRSGRKVGGVAEGFRR
jgi:hypothetical protein